MMEWLKNHKGLLGIGCGVGIVAFFCVIVLGVLAWFFLPKLLNKDKPIEFVTYERTDVAFTSWGSPSGITVKFDVPQGDYPQVETAIRLIISKSQMAKELGEPIGETLQQVADNFVELFKEAIGKDEYGTTQFDLLIEQEYQNKECVVFHVADGIYGNGGPHEYDLVVRLKDGHVMEQSEMIFISEDRLKELVMQYADSEQREQVFLEEGYYLSPCAEGVKLLWPIGSHFTGECIIPLSEIEGYLTDDARQLFTAKGFDTVAAVPSVATPDEEEPAEEVSGTEEDVVKGDLAIFELRGPVKEFVFKSGDYKVKRTFDQNGKWIKVDGKGLSSLFPGGVKRDGQGRMIKGKYDPLEDLSITFEFDAQGRIATITDQPYLDGGDITTYNYNSNGTLVSITTQYTGMDAIDEETGEEDGPSVSNVTILETDSHSNWTKRQLGDVVQTRTITYY